MRYASLVAAVALVLLANAFALLHAARNRSGEPEAEITLTDRELSYYRHPDDSGVALRLRWVDPHPVLYSGAPWLDQTRLEELGFDCRVAPSDAKASSFYSRQIPRAGWVALEYDGPAWQSWLELRRQMAQPAEPTPPAWRRTPEDDRRSASRLALIDAARDAAALRARHPDRHRLLIIPAVLRISWDPALPAAEGRPASPARLTGYVREIPSLIHVPRPFSDSFRALRQTFREPEREEPLYRVRLRYGSLLEPWVTGVEAAPRHE